MINSRSIVIYNAATAATAKACGHVRHVGCCGCCQRAQLSRWTLQLTEVTAHPRARLNGGARDA
jgi:hypothetical protein